MEAVLDPVSSWAVGDPWPQPQLGNMRQSRLRGRRPGPPLLSLSLGPVCVALLPRPPPLAAAAAASPQDAAEVPPQFGNGESQSEDGSSSSGGSGGAVQAAATQLQRVLEERAPGLPGRLAATGVAVDNSFLQRWLQARGGSVETAAEGILAHAAWRESFVGHRTCTCASGSVPSGTAAASSSSSSASGIGLGICECSIPDELAAQKVFLQGLDTEGCPVVVVKASRHDMGKRDLQQTKRLIAYILDNACATATALPTAAASASAAATAKVPADASAATAATNDDAGAGEAGSSQFGQVCCLFDLSGLRPRNLDAKVLLAIFEMLQQQYPERLNSLYFLNAPIIFGPLWRLISPLVHANTRRKIRFLGGVSGRRQLLQRIPEQVLPSEYGGTAELLPIDAAMAAWRQQQAAARSSAAPSESAAGTAGQAADGRGGNDGGSGHVAALRRQAGSAVHATRHFVHHRLLRPVGGAASGAARILRHQQQQLLLRMLRQGGKTVHGDGTEEHERQLLLEQQQRSLLAQVVLTQMLLVGLLLRMLSQVLLRRPAPALRTSSPAPPPSGDDANGAFPHKGLDQDQAREAGLHAEAGRSGALALPAAAGVLSS